MSKPPNEPDDLTDELELLREAVRELRATSISLEGCEVHTVRLLGRLTGAALRVVDAWEAGRPL